jgi:hypothetical protein
LDDFQSIKFHHFYEIAEDRIHVSDDNEHFVRKYFNISSTSDEKFSTKLCKKKNFYKKYFFDDRTQAKFYWVGGPESGRPCKNFRIIEKKNFFLKNFSIVMERKTGVFAPPLGAGISKGFCPCGAPFPPAAKSGRT